MRFNQWKWIAQTLTGVSVFVCASATPVWASSHREAPAISLDPAADNTDVYAWVTPGTHEFLNVVMNYIPLEEPAGGPNFHQFDDSVRYELHIARGPNSLRDAATYYVYFKTQQPTRVPYNEIATNENLFNGIQFFSQIATPPPQQTYKVVKVEYRGGREYEHEREHGRDNGREVVLVDNAPVAPANIGPRTDAIVYGQDYDDAYAATFIRDLSGGGRVWAGPRDDGFYVDLGGIFDLANITSGRSRPTDGVAGFNVHSIAFEIPTSQLTGTGRAPTAGATAAQTLGIWAAASRRQGQVRSVYGDYQTGRWVQVSRLGLPLINEAVIGLQDKDRWNRLAPKDDLAYFAPYFLHPVAVRNASAVGIYAELGVPAATVEALKHGPDGNGRFDIIDVINLKNIPNPGDHTGAQAIKSIGDVLRVDLGVDSAFPNGRPIPGGVSADQEQADVTDVLLTVILSGGAIPISDNVNRNDKPFLSQMPWLASPWQGFDEGHGKPAL